MNNNPPKKRIESGTTDTSTDTAPRTTCARSRPTGWLALAMMWATIVGAITLVAPSLASATPGVPGVDWSAASQLPPVVSTDPGGTTLTRDDVVDVVCIGDGAAWLRRLYAEWFPNAVAVVDFLHAAEYLWAAARARYGPESDLAKRWALRLCRELKAGRADKVLAALRRAGGEESARAAAYIEARRGQMRYDEYLARGWPIGSGRAEAACKTVVGRRMKCTGMRWSVAGANPVLWVRCANLSGWLADYWDQRLGIAA